jgi:predicted RND superfamily exporter protein
MNEGAARLRVERWLAGVRRRRWALVLIAAPVLAIALPGLLRLRPDNSARVYFPRQSAKVAAYDRFVALFGADDMVRLVVRGEDLWTPGGLEKLRGLAEEARRLDGVDAVASLDRLGSGGAWPPTDPLAFRAEASARPLARGLGLVGNGARAVSVLLALGRRSGPERDVLLGELAGIARRARRAAPALEVEVVGGPRLTQAFDGSSREIGVLWFPLLVAVSVLLLTVLFRGWRWVVAPLAFVVLVQILALGIAGFAGARLNLVLGILPPLLYVVALASAVHLATRVRALQQSGLEPWTAVVVSYVEKGEAMLWTTLSAAVGFASLTLTDVPPVRQLGWLAVAGLAAIALFGFTILPWLLLWAARSKGVLRQGERALAQVGARIAEASAHNFRRVLVLVAVVALVAGWGIPRLRVESDGLRYLPTTHPVRQETLAAEAEGIGGSAIEWMLDSPAGFADGGALNRLAWIGVRLREELESAGVLGVVSAGELIEDALRTDAQGAAAIGGSAPREAALRRLRESEEGRSVLREFLSDDGRTARLTVFVKTGGYPEFDAVVPRVEAILAEELPGAARTVTGAYSLILETQRLLLATLRLSFAATVAGIVIVLFLILRRFRLTVLALIPNILPVWTVLGLMGWWGVPLDLATVMVASTTLGLALDDTLHTLVPFRRLAAHTGSFESLLMTVERNAAAYSASGLILGLGFAVCALSSFAPIRRFGALSALAIVLAVLADFLLVPALLGRIPRRWVVRAKAEAARESVHATARTDPPSERN